MATLKFERVRTLVDRKVKFTWRGGEYIEYGLVGYAPIEVVNVFDYEKGAPSIPRTRTAFVQAVDEYISEYGAQELERDLTLGHEGAYYG